MITSSEIFHIVLDDMDKVALRDEIILVREYVPPYERHRIIPLLTRLADELEDRKEEVEL